MVVKNQVLIFSVVCLFTILMISALYDFLSSTGRLRTAIILGII